MNENPGMWDYWRDKHGVKDALLYDYPDTLERNGQLRLALDMIENGERLIESIMNELYLEVDND